MLPNRVPGTRTSLRNKTGPRTPAACRLPVRNRVRVLLVHIPAFSIQGQARLAHDAGVARSTVSRLVNGQISPSYRLARAVTDALERKMGQPLDIRDVFTTDGTYPTPSGCALCGCQGCLPEDAWGEDDALKPEWKDARPGDWSLARPPQAVCAIFRNRGHARLRRPHARSKRSRAKGGAVRAAPWQPPRRLSRSWPACACSCWPWSTKTSPAASAACWKPSATRTPGPPDAPSWKGYNRPGGGG